MATTTSTATPASEGGAPPEFASTHESAVAPASADAPEESEDGFDTATSTPEDDTPAQPSAADLHLSRGHEIIRANMANARRLASDYPAVGLLIPAISATLHALFAHVMTDPEPPADAAAAENSDDPHAAEAARRADWDRQFAARNARAASDQAKAQAEEDARRRDADEHLTLVAQAKAEKATQDATEAEQKSRAEKVAKAREAAGLPPARDVPDDDSSLRAERGNPSGNPLGHLDHTASPNASNPSTTSPAIAETALRPGEVPPPGDRDLPPPAPSVFPDPATSGDKPAPSEARPVPTPRRGPPNAA